MRFLLIGLVIAANVAVTPVHAEEIRYAVLYSGKEIGFHTIDQISPNRWDVVFYVDENGRGAQLKGAYQLSTNGWPRQIEITGKGWFHAPVDERFKVTTGRARWQTTVDEGDVYDDGKHFYLANDSTPFDMLLLSHLLSVAEDGYVDLYPTGRANGEKLVDIEIDGARYELHAIFGLTAEPYLHWLDRNGGLVASLYSRSIGIVRDDLVGWINEFGDAQQRWIDSRNAERNEKFRQKTEGLAVFRNVAVFDFLAAERIMGRDVFVVAGIITDVRETGGTLPEDAQVIEGNGGTLLPGLWDVHTHSTDPTEGFSHVAFGVTSVREIGNDPADVLYMRDQIVKGDAIGPRQWIAGLIEGESDTATSAGRLATTLDDALSYVDWYADRGFGQIKIYNSINPDWVKPIIQHAHSRGLKVSGHVPAFMRAGDVVRAGYDEINHINMLFLNFLLEDGDDTRTMLRFTRLGERGGTVDVDSQEVRSFLNELKSKGVAVDPTIRIFLRMMYSRSGMLDPTAEYFLERMPAIWQRNAYKPFLNIHPGHDDNYREAGRALRRMLKRLHDEGVLIIPGTDDAPGYSLHGELFEWVKSGIPAAEVLRYATYVPARYFGLDHTIGSIERGKRAELILVDGDPVKDIRDLRHIRLVMQGESIFDAPRMLQELSIAP